MSQTLKDLKIQHDKLIALYKHLDEQLGKKHQERARILNPGVIFGASPDIQFAVPIDTSTLLAACVKMEKQIQTIDADIYSILDKQRLNPAEVSILDQLAIKYLGVEK